MDSASSHTVRTTLGRGADSADECGGLAVEDHVGVGVGRVRDGLSGGELLPANARSTSRPAHSSVKRLRCARTLMPAGHGQPDDDVVGPGEDGVTAVAGHDELLIAVGDLDGLWGGHEGGAQPGAVGAGRQGGGQGATVGDAAGGEERHVWPAAGRGGQEREKAMVPV